ncbi:MAG: hypothetical protein JW709_00185 [Sedimentisphaerales bacterium]|nr:hypothetical protein [Sedimentisphaerales bacterium]
MNLNQWFIIVIILFVFGLTLYAQDKPILIPALEGEWVHVAHNPDIGEYQGENQQPVDFGVWQARDGSWQLWSCIRGTKAGGTGRLFHGWEGKCLTQPDWTPKGVVMTADTSVGETPGGLQAPHVVMHNNLYYMAYGDWNNICFATSFDGKTFTRVIRQNGNTGAFSDGPGANTRDAMMLKVGNEWLCYYTAFPPATPPAPETSHGYVFVRRSCDLYNWSDSTVVSYGGKAGNNIWSCECPHVVAYDGKYYLFRTQRYGLDALTTVYCSLNPYHFGIDNDQYLVCEIKVAAPEIIIHQGKYYLAALDPNYDGIRITPLKWIPKPEEPQKQSDQ